MKIIFTGGGTAGHILPVIAIIREIKKIYQGQNLRMYYIGPKDSFTTALLSKENIKVMTVSAGKIRRYPGIDSFFLNIFDVLFKIPLGIIQSFFIIFFTAPDLVFSKGGYGAVPVTLGAAALRVPIFMHESDIVAGAANTFLSKFSKEIFISFPINTVENLPKDKMILVGNPIRKEILESEPERAKQYLGITGEKPVILILGGSQGSRRINDMLLQILPNLLFDFEIIHQCGEKNFAQVQAESRIMMGEKQEKYYHLFAFMKEDDLKKAFAASDLVVSRAGSSSIFEIAAAVKPSILIPLAESAQNHQFKNAYHYSETGACLVIEEANLTPRFFLEKLRFLISRPEEMDKMRNAAAEFARPLAAEIIAQYILDYFNAKK